MACVDEKCLYPGKNKGMEDDILTLDEISDHVTRRGGYSGVRIREFDDGNVNPDPVKRDDEETEDLWEEFLSPNKLKSLSGVNNLDDVTCLEMQVNTNEHSLGNFGGMLPNLIQLKLSNSILSTVRDLGTSLGNLKILWMSQCGLTDLDGISSLSSLVELFVAFNDISDVSPVSMLDNLEVLDLEGNLIDDLSQVEFLSLCSTLKSLNLEGNPVCVAPHANSSAEEMAGYEYRKAILQAVPRLKILDDELFLVEKVGGKEVLRDMPKSAKSAKVPDHLKDEWQMISNALKTVENEQDETESAKSVPAARPTSARNDTRPKTAMSRQRPSSAMRQRPGSSIGQRPGSSNGQRPGSSIGQRPGSALGSSGSSSELSGIFQGDDSSDLTHGSGEVICGNISKALKARRKNIKAFNSVIPPFTDNSPIHTPEKSYEEENETNLPSKHDVFTELRQWRQQFAKFLEEDHKLPTSVDTESSQSEGESPFSSPRKTEAADSSSSTSPTTPRPDISPSPPPIKEHCHKRPSPLGRSLPTAPLVGRDLQRPHTSGEFRIRRYRQASTEEKVDRLLKNKLDLDVNENRPISTVEPRTPLPASAVVETEPRSSSAPVRALRRYRVLPNTPGTRRTSEDSPQPSSKSPVNEVSPGYRPGTAAAALQKRRLKPN